MTEDASFDLPFGLLPNAKMLADWSASRRKRLRAKSLRDCGISLMAFVEAIQIK
jgi:hypothetical protein